MTYLEYLNGLIRKRAAETENCVFFGQNINAGSCLGGLTRNVKMHDSGSIFNSTNSENSLVGFGFGLMMNGCAGVFLMKQLDFLLLGIDQLVNTYNIIRNVRESFPSNGSFTILATVVDSGYEGPQSSFNGLSDLCSIARVDGFSVTNAVDAEYIFNHQFAKPGFRIIGLSQRLGKTEVNENMKAVKVFDNGKIFQYSAGSDVTLVSYNFSSPQALELKSFLESKGYSVDYFHHNAATAEGVSPILTSVAKTGNVVLIDDSKCIQTPLESTLAALCGTGISRKVILKRNLGTNWLNPVSDIFEIDHNKVLAALQ